MLPSVASALDTTMAFVFPRFRGHISPAAEPKPDPQRGVVQSGVYDSMTLRRVVQSLYAVAIAFIMFSAFQVAWLKVSLVLPFNTIFILGWQIVVQTKERCIVLTTVHIERKIERDEKKHSLPSFATLVDPRAANDLPVPSVALALIGLNMGLIALSLALSSGFSRFLPVDV